MNEIVNWSIEKGSVVTFMGTRSTSLSGVYSYDPHSASLLLGPYFAWAGQLEGLGLGGAAASRFHYEIRPARSKELPRHLVEILCFRVSDCGCSHLPGQIECVFLNIRDQDPAYAQLAQNRQG